MLVPESRIVVLELLLGLVVETRNPAHLALSDLILPLNGGNAGAQVAEGADFNVQIAKIAAAASVGSLAEWYDFFISGVAAAAIWPVVFFPTGNFAVSVALSIATYGVVFFMRPFGAFLFGHFGDRLGRKSILVWTLMTMGLGTLGIALTPSYASLGVAAPILVVTFRLVQGLGLGGEFGGAATWLSEFASASKRRSFWTGWMQAAIPLGIALASLTYYFIGSTISHPALLAWGWRLPFFIGSAVLVFGMVIRYRMGESPLFAKLAREKGVEKEPAAAALRADWKKIVLLGLVSAPSAVVGNFVILPFAVSLMVVLGLSPALASLLVGLSALFGVLWVMAGAALGDVIGRRKVLLSGILIIMVGVYPSFVLILTGNPFLALLGLLLNGGEFLAPSVLAAFLPEQFPTGHRYSGAGLSFQMGGLFTGIATSILLPAILVYTGGPLKAWPYVAAGTAAFCAIAALSMVLVKETKDSRLQD